MFYLNRSIALISILLILSCATDTSRKTDPDKFDISGFEELTPDEYLELTAGRSFKGTYEGLDYVQSHPQDKGKRFSGVLNGQPFSGRWKAGENNCTVIVFNFSEQPICWKLLHKDGEYVYARYNLKGTKLLSSHYVTFLD